MNYLTLKSQIKKKPEFSLLKYGDIFHVHFKNPQELALTFMRVQEFYESPHFKNKTISLWNFFNYYKKFTHKKRFTYLLDWNGFNVPDYAVKEFIKLNTLNEKEKSLFSILGQQKSFYIIGTSGNKNSKDYKEVFTHEKAHALYYLNQEYKSKADLIIKNLHNFKLISYFKKLGYNKSVFKDETQAWLLADFDYLVQLEILSKKDKKFHLKLKSNFKKFK